MEATKIYYIGKSNEERMLNNLSDDERRIHKINKYGIELERGSNRNRVKVTNGKKIGGGKKMSYKNDKDDMKKKDSKRKIRNEYKTEKNKYTTREGEKEKIKKVMQKFKKTLNKIPRKIKITSTAILLATAVSMTYVADKAEKNSQEKSVNLIIENGEAAIKTLEDMEVESDGIQFYTGDLQKKDLQKYKMLFKTTSKETLIIDKNNQPIKRMGKDSIVFAKPEMVVKDGEKYLKVVYFDNDGMTEGLIKIDGLKLSQIYDEEEIKDIKEVEIRGKKDREVTYSNGKHLGMAQVNAEIYTTGEQGISGWRKVIYRNENDLEFRTGYIEDIYIEDKTSEVLVNTEKDGGVDLNIRNEADINGSIIGKVKNKSTIKIVDSTDEDLIIGKDGKKYYQVIFAKSENSNIEDGVNPLNGEVYVDGVRYSKGYVNADYIDYLIKQTDLER